jgi:hypothetical protein
LTCLNVSKVYDKIYNGVFSINLEKYAILDSIFFKDDLVFGRYISFLNDSIFYFDLFLSIKSKWVSVSSNILTIKISNKKFKQISIDRNIDTSLLVIFKLFISYEFIKIGLDQHLVLKNLDELKKGIVNEKLILNSKLFESFNQSIV